jgi:hypothetical protein
VKKLQKQILSLVLVVLFSIVWNHFVWANSIVSATESHQNVIATCHSIPDALVKVQPFSVQSVQCVQQNKIDASYLNSGIDFLSSKYRQTVFSAQQKSESITVVQLLLLFPHHYFW